MYRKDGWVDRRKWRGREDGRNKGRMDGWGGCFHKGGVVGLGGREGGID